MGRAAPAVYPTSEQLQKNQSRESSPYSEVHCLLFSWRETDIDVEDEIWELRSCLEFGLFWSVAKHQIPTTGPDNYIATQINGLLDSHGKNHNALLVIVYSGHSSVNNGQMLWAGSSATVNWEHLQHNVENRAEADVLFIFDTCHAGRAARGSRAVRNGLKNYHNNGRRDSKQEVLGACDVKATTPGAGPKTYTKRVLQRLADITRSGHIRTTDNLHSMLVEDQEFKRLTVTPFRLNLIPNQSPIILEPCYRAIHDAVREMLRAIVTLIQDSKRYRYIVIVLRHDRTSIPLRPQDLVGLLCCVNRRIERVVSNYIKQVGKDCKGTISLKYGRTVLAPTTRVKKLEHVKRELVGEDYADDKLFVLQAIEERYDEGSSDADATMSVSSGASENEFDS